MREVCILRRDWSSTRVMPSGSVGSDFVTRKTLSRSAGLRWKKRPKPSSLLPFS